MCVNGPSFGCTAAALLQMLGDFARGAPDSRLAGGEAKKRRVYCGFERFSGQKKVLGKGGEGKEHGLHHVGV